MNSAPRRRLRDILGQHGLELVGDPRRTKALLMDLCGEHKLEINLLSAAQEERIAGDLLKMPRGTPKAMLFDQFVRRLQENRGLAPDAARWAVESWAIALGVAVPNEFGAAQAAPAAARPQPARMSTPMPHPATAGGPAPQTAAFPMADLLPAGSFLQSALQILMTAGPRVLGAGRRVFRIFKTLRLTTQSLTSINRSAIPRAIVRVLGSAAVGALLWALGGALGGGFFGLLTTAFDGVAREVLIAAMLNWLIIGASVGGVLGALTGMSIGVIRYYGETGGTVIGALTGLAVGALLGPLGISSVFETGALTSAIFAIVSLGMISGQGRNVLQLTFMANGMAGTCLRKSDGWVAIGKAALWGGIGSLVVFVPLVLIGFRDLPLTAAAGWAVGLVSGAIIGNKYKLLKYL